MAVTTTRNAGTRSRKPRELAGREPLEYVVPKEFTDSLSAMSIRDVVSLLTRTVFISSSQIPKENEMKTVAILKHLEGRSSESKSDPTLKIILETRLTQSGFPRSVRDAAQSLLDKTNQ